MRKILATIAATATLAGVGVMTSPAAEAKPVKNQTLVCGRAVIGHTSCITVTVLHGVNGHHGHHFGQR